MRNTRAYSEDKCENNTQKMMTLNKNFAFK